MIEYDIILLVNAVEVLYSVFVLVRRFLSFSLWDLVQSSQAPPSPRPSESEGNREEVEEEEEGEETPMKTSETSASSSLSVTEERTGSETRGATNEIKNSVPLSPVVLKSESENIQETSKLDRNAPVVKGPSFPPLELRGSNSPEDGNPSERKKAEKQKKKNMPPKVWCLCRMFFFAFKIRVSKLFFLVFKKVWWNICTPVCNMNYVKMLTCNFFYVCM